MTNQDSATLFTNALNTTNTALEENANQMPFKQILSAAEKVLGDRQLGVAIYKDDPDSPYDYFTLRFSNGAFEIVSHGKDHPSIDWKVSQEYLERIAENPKRYVDDPFKLDFDWLTSRLGIQ
jgi:hypothetical protein